MNHSQYAFSASRNPPPGASYRTTPAPTRNTSSTSSAAASRSQVVPQHASATAKPTVCQTSKDTSTTSTATTTTTTKSKWPCKACDVTLDSEMAFTNHTQSHVKCSDCSFEGIPKVVKGHFQSVHGKFSGSGFKSVTIAIPGCRVQRFKICVGNRPEDIQKWIADRKRKFPRQQSQELQQVQVQPQTEQKLKAKATATAMDETHQDAMTRKESDTIEAVGLTSLLAGYGSSSTSDDDADADIDKVPEIPTMAASSSMIEPTLDAIETTDSTENALLALNSTSAQSMEVHPSENNGGTSRRPTPTSRPCHFFMRNGRCRNGDSCSYSHDMTKVSGMSASSRLAPTSTTTITTRRQEQHNKRSETLLRRLLANDMRRETTLTLKLLKYVARRNYLQSNGNLKTRLTPIPIAPEPNRETRCDE
jgi:Zinc finger C-x8-C-x5-C-x3-H type (and similar)/Nuclear fragile X mental retardation-interacting protein 1 (NUFIP1)